MPPITKDVIRLYLADSLPPDQAAPVERLIRDDPAVQLLVREVRAETDPAEHSVGAVWRRERLTCPTRETLGSYLQDLLDPAYAEYVAFHLKVVACPICAANHDDLLRQQTEPQAARQKRRQRLLDTSAEFLRKKPE